MLETPPPAAFRLRADAEQIAARLPPLLVSAQRVALSVTQGVHGRKRVGIGETFWHYRPYDAQSDSAARIDWRRSAKSNRHFVRETEWEAAQTVWLWRDMSASMDWRSSPKLLTKRAYADVLALALSCVLVKAGEQVGLIGSGLRATADSKTPERLANIMMRQDTSPAPLALRRPDGAPLPRHSACVLLTDALDDPALLRRALAEAAERHIGGCLVQILDPAEETLPYKGRTRFEGLENEQADIVPRAEKLRDDYRAILAERRDNLANLCRHTGWRFIMANTATAPEKLMLRLWQELSASHISNRPIPRGES